MVRGSWSADPRKKDLDEEAWGAGPGGLRAAAGCRDVGERRLERVRERRPERHDLGQPDGGRRRAPGADHRVGAVRGMHSRDGTRPDVVGPAVPTRRSWTGG